MKTPGTPPGRAGNTDAPTRDPGPTRRHHRPGRSTAKRNRAGAVTFGSAGPRPVVPCRQTESAKGCRDIRCSGASGESSGIFRRGGQPADCPVEAAHPPKETNSFAACMGLGGNVELTRCRRFLRQRHGEPCRHVCDSSRLHRPFGRAPIIALPILGGRRHRHWLVLGLCGAVSRMLGPFGGSGQRMGVGEPVFGKLRCGQALGGCGVYGYT